jgi:hypothetical protein
MIPEQFEQLVKTPLVKFLERQDEEPQIELSNFILLAGHFRGMYGISI